MPRERVKAAAAALAARRPARRGRFAGRSLAPVLLALAGACQGAREMPAPATPAERWRADLACAVDALRRLHPDPHERASRAELDRRVLALDAAIPELGEDEVRAELARILALAGDSHTRSTALDALQDPLYPIAFQSFAGELHVAAVRAGHEALFGAKLLALEGNSSERALERVGSLIGHENEVLLRRAGGSLLNAPRILVQSGLLDVPGPCTYTLLARDGSVREARLDPEPADSAGWLWIAPQDFAPPTARSRPGEPYWWTFLAEHAAVYLRYDECRDAPERPFESVAREILARIDAGGVRKLVVDLRANSGGDSAVLAALVRGLRARPAIDRSGALFVLIGPATYSSGMLNAHQLREQTAAILVGEPTSQKPNAFGEIRTVELPWSRVRLSVSTKRFRLLDHDPGSLEPDVQVETTFDDVWRGRDPVLDWVLGEP